MFTINAVTPEMVTIISTLIGISITFAVISYLVYFPVKKTINERQDFIKNNIDDSIKKNKEADKFLEESEKTIKQSLSDSDIILGNSRDDAKKIKKEAFVDSEQDIVDLKNNLEKSKNTEMKKYSEKFNEEVVELALEISRNVISKEIDDSYEEELINSFMKEIQNHESSK